MSIASDKIIDPQQAEMEAHLSAFLHQRVIASERVGGGKNSQVYHLTCDAGGQTMEYAIKRYFRHSADARDRLGVEYAALHFMAENGISCVPRPLTVDRDGGYAVYEYIRGEKICAESILPAEIDEAVAFLSRLEEIKGQTDSAIFEGASEACFSIQAIVDNVENRLARLTAVQEQGTSYDALRAFLTKDFQPAFREILEWCADYANRKRISFSEDIPPEKRTLSPSDFGFHNALRRDGKMVFLDFEYFGWDDPAKMLVDFLLHPALPMQISDELRKRYIGGLLKHFAADYELVHRTRIVYPLFGLKWIMIILNEFLTADYMRRQFAQEGFQDKDRLQSEQLIKAKHWLKKIQSEYKEFPYA